MRWKVFLALLAITLHALAPLRAGATPQQVELCTAHGVVMVQLEPDDGAPASQAAEHCSVCVFHAGISGPVRAQNALPAAAGSPPSLQPTPVVPAPTRTAARPRAPPPAS